MVKNCIIGAGITGLSLAHFLGEEAVILEKDAVAGGLCRSFKKEPFTYDIGGHIIFSKDKEALDFMLNIVGENKRKLYRNNKIYYKGTYVKYPFENGLHQLPKEDIFKCLYNFINNKNPEPTNFKEWIYHRFGDGFAELYLVPYNEKIWKHPLENMNIEWVERIPRPPSEDIIKAAVGIETEGYTHQLYFHYPISGGIQSMIESIRDSLPKDKMELKLNSEVSSIRKKGNGWMVETVSGDKIEADRIISTMPIFHLIKAMDDIPQEVKDAADKLVYNSMYVVLVGVNNSNAKDKLGIYIPDKDVIFHRLVMTGYFGDEYTGKDSSALVAEVTFPPGSDLEKMSEDEIKERVVSDLVKLNMIKREEVTETEVKKIPYAYVVYDKDYKENVEVIHRHFQERGIHLCGRFSEFEYINMDACIRHAMELAKKLRGE
ncbi:MAG: FAD-dependent oxidoreductase [Nanoarchaeota archaeon]